MAHPAGRRLHGQRALGGGHARRRVVLELTDQFLPENSGRWRIGRGGAERSDAAAEISLDITGLGSVYLGGFSFADLVRGSRAEELVGGAVERADALFRTGAEPWCAEIF